MSSTADVLAEARPIADAFTGAGHRIFLVGGVVRDLVLGRVAGPDQDLDLTTDATPDQVRVLLEPLADALWFQGERFGTIGARVDDRVYEVTTHRAEAYTTDSRKPRVVFSQEIEHDLSRRDFTVNAMALELPGGDLVDPFGGHADLDAGVLRTPLDPRVSFGDDPLRMLRAARFVAGYGLEPTAELVEAMNSMSDRLAIVSVERVREEIDKLLGIAAPDVGLALLDRTGLIAEVWPWTRNRVPRNLDVDALPDSALVRLAAMVFDPDSAVVRRRMRALRHSRARTAATETIAAAAARLVDHSVVDRADFRRWYRAVGVHRESARLVAVAVSPDAVDAVQRSRDLEAELLDELEDLGAPIDAATVMATLGIGPGPLVGAALDFLTDRRLDTGPMTPECAIAELRRWWRDRASSG